MFQLRELFTTPLFESLHSSHRQSNILRLYNFQKLVDIPQRNTQSRTALTSTSSAVCRSSFYSRSSCSTSLFDRFSCHSYTILFNSFSSIIFSRFFTRTLHLFTAADSVFFSSVTNLSSGSDIKDDPLHSSLFAPSVIPKVVFAVLTILHRVKENTSFS